VNYKERLKEFMSNNKLNDDQINIIMKQVSKNDLLLGMNLYNKYKDKDNSEQSIVIKKNLKLLYPNEVTKLVKNFGVKLENYKERLKGIKESIMGDIQQEINELFQSGLPKIEVKKKMLTKYPSVDEYIINDGMNNYLGESFREKLNNFREAYLPSGFKIKYKDDGVTFQRGPFDSEEEVKRFAKDRQIKDFEIIKSKKESYKEALEVGDKVKVGSDFPQRIGTIKKKIGSDSFEVEYKTAGGIIRTDKYYDSELKKESYTEVLTLDDVSQKKFKKNFSDLSDAEKSEANYFYSEWNDESEYDEKCGTKKEALQKLKEKFIKKEALEDQIIASMLKQGKSDNEILDKLKNSTASKQTLIDIINFYKDKMKRTSSPYTLESYKERLSNLREYFDFGKFDYKVGDVVISPMGKKYRYKVIKISNDEIKVKDLNDGEILYFPPKNLKKESYKERLNNLNKKESSIQLVGAYNIPKLKAKLGQTCNDFGLNLQDNGKIDFNDNKSLLKREINEFLGNLKNMGINYRLTEGIKDNTEDNLEEKLDEVMNHNGIRIYKDDNNLYWASTVNDTMSSKSLDNMIKWIDKNKS